MTWQMVSYCGDFRTARQTTHPEPFLGTPAQALAAAEALAATLDSCWWVVAVSNGPDIETLPGWKDYPLVERPDGKGWDLHFDGLQVWERSRSSAVSYAMHRGAPHPTVVRMWNLDGSLRKVVLGFTGTRL